VPVERAHLLGAGEQMVARVEAYKARPEWEADYQPAPVRKVRHLRRLRHKKM
jgi:hypothetical protein